MHRHSAHSAVGISRNPFCLRIAGVRNVRRHIATKVPSQQAKQTMPPLRQPRSLPSEQHEGFEKLTNELINRTAGPNPKSWKHTKTLRGEEKRLAQAVKTTPATYHSAEQTKFAYGADMDELFNESDESTSSFSPGTFVEIRRNAISTHAIVLGELFHHDRWMIASLTSSGAVYTHLKEDVMFDLPAIVPEDLATRCGLMSIGDNQVEVNARVELLRRIRQMELSVSGIQTQIIRDMKSIYAEFKSHNPDKWGQVTVADVVKIVAPQSSADFLTRFAVHKQLMAQPKEFVADPLVYRTSHRFDVRPQAHVDRLNTIVTWTRLKDGPLQSFATRAIKITAENQQTLKESWGEPHSEHPRDIEVFTPDDAVIINFLRDSLRTSRAIQVDPYPVQIASILRTIGIYESEVSDSLVGQLLVDLGVMAPWQDMVSQRRELNLDQQPEENSPLVAAQNAIVERALTKPKSTTTAAGEVLGPEDFYTHDLLESVRHDFGNLPVYVIDEAGAEELDDGISIERIPSEPDSAWVHVHIADPTAVLPPSHIFAQTAREKLETIYFGHRTWPMLPRSVMQGLLGSVGAEAASGQPERVMSFSFKVDSTGNIVDYNVRAGIIRNVTRATYDDVDHALGQPLLPPKYPFGGEAPTPSSPINLNETQLTDVRSLDKIVERMFKRLVQLPVWSTTVDRCSLNFSPKPLYTSVIDPQKPHIFRGFPSIAYTVPDYQASFQGARLMVSQCMTAASRIASRWAVDRGLPLLRRSSGQPMTLSDNDFAEILASKNSFGFIDTQLALAKEIINPPAGYTLEPAIHWPLGIPEGEGYCRVTSPLRRHSDMVTHWQIKHALLHPTSATPLFSREWLEDYGRDLAAREKMRKRAEGDHKDFWALRFIQRWMQNPTRPDGPDPLARMVGYIATQPQTNQISNDIQTKVNLPELGLRAFLVGLRNRPELKAGEAHGVKIKEIRLGVKPKLVLEMK